MRRRTIAAIAAAALLAAGPGVAAAAGSTPTAPSSASATPTPDGSFTLSGAEAAAFRLPAGMVEVRSFPTGDGGTTTRYQQKVGAASVHNGQVSVLTDAAGVQTAVVGAYFPGLKATTTDKVGRTKARALAKARNAKATKVVETLRIDPRSGRQFYSVVTGSADTRVLTWVDAASGAVTKNIDLLHTDESLATSKGRTATAQRKAAPGATGTGVGVKNDAKTLDTSQTASGLWQLKTASGRQETYDAQNNTTLPGVMMTDADNVWNTTAPLYVSPDQRPGVDAHYYAGVVDKFYGETYRRNSIDNNGMKIISTVHYDKAYCNAFWNGEQMTYGDGDGVTCLPLSGGLDVVGHELTHGVTEFTSGLIYENEPGALNEAFSDMMGNTIEFYAASKGMDPAATPDWRIGEDVITRTQGFRNMGDPQEFGDPDHISEKYTGTADNGGVHSNSGIPNHVYYLAVNGGKNAGCGSSPSGHTHADDCDVTVPALGLTKTQKIFYDGFTAMTEYANFCDARAATMAVAGKSAAAIGKAWDAVGVHTGCAPGTPPPPPCVGDANATVPFESPHPYGNNGDCTWTYNHGTAGFAFHFSMLETEAGYDYVHVKDGNGNVLATYDGTHPLGQTSPCIPTATGSVQLVTDPGVVDQGFVVDKVVACTP